MNESDKRKFADRCSVSWPCREICDGDLSSCPFGWTLIGDAVCAAPRSYNKCQLLQGFRGWTDHMKFDYAHKCGVSWPCLAKDVADNVDGPVVSAACTELNMAPCPLAWTSSKNGVCHPPTIAAGLCTQPIQTGSMTVEQKLAWAGDCLLMWPCGDADSSLRNPWSVSVPGN